MLVLPESSSAVLVMTSSKSVSICNRSVARRANSGEMTISWGGHPYLMLSYEENLFTQPHTICSQETRDCAISYGKNTEFLSHLNLNRYRVVTDGQTELRQLIRAKHYVLSRVKRWPMMCGPTELL